jgi:FkbM family methyltransferase
MNNLNWEIATKITARKVNSNKVSQRLGTDREIYIFLRSSLRRIFSMFNLGLVKRNDLNYLRQTQIAHQCLVNKLDFFLDLQDRAQKKSESSSFEILNQPNLLLESKSENGQDLFALFANKFKRHGTFLEFGAYDGITFSNTFLLEKQLNWSGVLVDPIPKHFDQMRLNRNCISIHAAITVSNKEFVKILESPASNLSKPVSKRSITDKTHRVPAYTLTEIMDKYFLAKSLDFLSIDVEGEDLEILASVDFSKYEINAICVEHNNRINSKEILKYMESDYELVWSEYSGNDFWFMRRVQPV